MLQHILLAGMINAALPAQYSVTVRGQAVDQRHVPISYTRAALPDFRIGVFSDSAGKFTLVANLPEGCQKVSVVSMGYSGTVYGIEVYQDTSIDLGQVVQIATLHERPPERGGSCEVPLELGIGWPGLDRKSVV